MSFLQTFLVTVATRLGEKIIDRLTSDEVLDKTVDNITGTKTKPEPKPVETIDYKASVSSLLKMSPRLSGCSVANVDGPTIDVQGWGGDGVRFASKEFGSGKIKGAEYMIVTSDGNSANDSAASHGFKDGRWNKFYGNNLKRFAIFLVKDNRKRITEYSKVIECK